MATLPVGFDARGARVGATQYGKASRDMERDSKRLDRSVRGVDSRISALGGTARRVKFALGGLFTTVLAGGGLRKATSILGGFEETMATVGGVTGATTGQMEALNETARRMGATTRFSAKESGEGLLFLARAGFETQEAISALPATLDLAVAGQIELGESADIASNILSQFNLAASETGRVADVLTSTSNSANTNVQQLAEAFKLAGPVAGSAGLSIEETAAAIGVLGDSGIQASLAGTNLRGAMAALLKPTGNAEKAISQLGLTMEDVDPTTAGLIGAFEKFGEANLGAADAVEIFGRRNAAAALILSGNVDKLRDLNEKNNEVENVTRKLAAMVDDTLIGALKSLRSVAEELVLQMGDRGLGKAIRSTVDAATDALRILADLPGAFDDASQSGKILSEVIRSMVPVIAAATAGVVALNAALLAGPGALVVALGAGIGLLIRFTNWVSEYESDTTQAAKAAGVFAEKQKLLNEQLKTANEVTTEFNSARRRLFETEAFGGDLSVGVDEYVFRARAAVTETNDLIAAVEKAKAELDFSSVFTFKSLDETINKLATLGVASEEALNAIAEGSTLDAVGTFNDLIDRRLNDLKDTREFFESKLTTAIRARARDLQFRFSESVKEFRDDLLVAFDTLDTRADSLFSGVREKVFEFTATREELERARINREANNLALAVKAGTLVGSFSTREGLESLQDIEEARARKIAELAGPDIPQPDVGISGDFDSGDANLDDLTNDVRTIKTELSDVERIANQTGDSFARAFTDMALGAKSASEAVEDLGRSILEMMTNQLIAAPLADALSAGITNTANRVSTLALPEAQSTQVAVPQARGGVFGSADRYAAGGVVNRPTRFMAARGAGLMGEAGPEAILPLRRTRGGRLGVESSGDRAGEVNVTVVNNSNEQASTRSRQNSNGGRDVIVMIGDAMATDVRQRGPLSQAIENTFGLQRGGVRR